METVLHYSGIVQILLLAYIAWRLDTIYSTSPSRMDVARLTDMIITEMTARNSR